MQMYSGVNVEKMKIYVPSMIMDQGERILVPSFDEFASDYLDYLKEDIILDRRTRISHRGDVEYLQVGLKGTHPRNE
jgi:hypothetical protein